MTYNNGTRWYYVPILFFFRITYHSSLLYIKLHLFCTLLLAAIIPTIYVVLLIISPWSAQCHIQMYFKYDWEGRGIFFLDWLWDILHLNVAHFHRHYPWFFSRATCMRCHINDWFIFFPISFPCFPLKFSLRYTHA